MRLRGPDHVARRRLDLVELLLILQQLSKIGERAVRGGGVPLVRGTLVSVSVFINVALVLHVMTIDAQQLPVAAVRGIVVVIMIFVVNSQLPQAFA